ncbi:hypothetical protein DPEC_G00294160 [Dallia pectoralis]|uniref:Uncharacterized protein n=1 Tax=Dallia pectoralis TaxID=75939 RepID=A0ACC2FID3_DALPE|nr:hypothetical protein DPEC_G00294160 [Dallia pectoralis]
MAPTIKEYHYHEGVYLICDNVYVGGTCQIDVHLDARTQGFPAEHCPERHTSFTRLSFFPTVHPVAIIVHNRPYGANHGYFVQSVAVETHSSRNHH